VRRRREAFHTLAGFNAARKVETIEDFGRGKGLGLISMGERVEVFRGTFEIRSTPAQGRGWKPPCHYKSWRIGI
jgi:signal transduction histidine kinase